MFKLEKKKEKYKDGRPSVLDLRKTQIYVGKKFTGLL